APPKFCNYPTPSICQYIAVYLVGSSMPTLDSWLRHLANPLRRIFQLQKRGFYIAQCLIRVNFKKNLSKKKSNKQLLCTKTTYKYGVWSAAILFLLLLFCICSTHNRRRTINENSCTVHYGSIQYT